MVALAVAAKGEFPLDIPPYGSTGMTCPPIIGPEVKLFFREKTLYIGGHYNGQETLHPRADNKIFKTGRSSFIPR